MTDISKYVKDATRTESPLDQVVVDTQLLAGVIQTMIAAGNMLDQIKKNVFYGKDFNNEKLVQEFTNVVGSLDQIKSSLSGNPETGVVDINPRVFHALVGIATESTELLEALAKGMSGEELDGVNLLEESFDVDWYQFILLDELGGKMEDVWDTGFAKLKKRYPEKFTSEDAIDRDVEAEREILEGGFSKG